MTTPTRAELLRRVEDQTAELDGVRDAKATADEQVLGHSREAVLEAHDVLAVNEGERGEVRDVKHDIMTGDSPPIRQQVHRVSFELRERVARMVNEMLQGGVVS